MVREQLVGRGVVDPATLAAMAVVPRESFVDPDMRDRAYRDGALSIGRGQTISQPYMVARMVESLNVAAHGWPWTGAAPAYLEVGTGSGYEAAVVAQIGASLISIERDAHLAREARRRLEELGYFVKTVVGDGSRGYEAGAPYAGIIVSAAAPSVPQPLLDQLIDGGRLVIPVGTRQAQRLTVIERNGSHFETTASDPCVFVPLIGEHGHTA